VTTQAVEAPRVSDAATDASPWQRLLALSGVAFAPLFVVGWLTSAVSNAPDYTAAEQTWINWAHDDHTKARVSSFALLLAAFVFIYFLGALRTLLGEAEAAVRGSEELARVAFAGALTGIVGMTMAFVTIANASAPGANADSVVSKAVTTSAAGPFLVGAAGFSAFLLATGVLTLRTGVLSRWTGFVALIGAGCFFVTLLTTLNNSGNGSAFGYAFFPALLSFVVWTVATSLARYRNVTPALPADAPA
jgi:succinate dehydrogenase/fumarate reductase cytochrome b subunit